MPLKVFISNEMLKCLHIKGRGKSMELLKQSSLRDSSVRVLIISVLRIHQEESAFKKYKSWLNFRREGSPACRALVRPCRWAVLPWRSAGCTGPPPRGRGSPASWWSQSSGWAGWRRLPLSWRTAHARTSAGTAHDERRRETFILPHPRCFFDQNNLHF